MAVGRGDAHHIDVLVGQQFLIIAVDFPAGPLRRGLHAGSVYVANGHRFDAALGFQIKADIDMRPAAAAGADKAHADPLVGSLRAFIGDREGRIKQRSRGCAGGRFPQKLRREDFEVKTGDLDFRICMLLDLSDNRKGLIHPISSRAPARERRFATLLRRRFAKKTGYPFAHHEKNSRALCSAPTRPTVDMFFQSPPRQRVRPRPPPRKIISAARPF